MKKQIILILFILGNLTTSFSQQFKKTAFDDLVGNYAAFPLGEIGSDAEIAVELTKDFNLKITENFDGLLIEVINEKVYPDAAKKFEGGYTFQFFPVSKKSEFNKIAIIIFSEPIVPNSEYSMSFSLKKGEEEVRAFIAKKRGGNPSIPNKDIAFEDIYTSVLYKGKTQDNTFGDYKIEWYPMHGLGILQYEHLRSMFLISKDGNEYRVKDRAYQDEIILDYFFEKNGKAKFKNVIQGKSFFAKEKIKKYKKSKEGIDEKDFLKFVATSLHDMIKPRFRPTGNYTLSESEKMNGSGFKFFVENKKAIAYVGKFKDGIFHGQGWVIMTDLKKSGEFNNGNQHGQFYAIDTKGEASGRFVDNKQEGTWKIKLNNGATFEKVFKNGKEISSKATNQGVENKKVSRLIADAQYETKSFKNSFDNIIDLANNCTSKANSRDDFTFRNYQYCLKPIANKISALKSGAYEANLILKKAMKEAEQSKCEMVFLGLRNANNSLIECEDNLYKAKKAFTDLHYTKTNGSFNTAFDKAIAAFKKATKAHSEYNFWLSTLDLGGETGGYKCYTYSTTNNSTLPSKNTSQSQSTTRNKTYPQSNTSSSSSSSSQNTTAKKIKTVTSSPVVYPTFKGKYEGDNLLLLMGRKVDDPAVQKLLKNPKYKFERKGQSGSLREKIDYECYPYRFSLSFINGIMTYISFEVKEWDNKNYFKKKLPLNIPLAKSTSAMKRMTDKWKHNDYGGSSNWTLEKYQLKFDVWGGGENNDIHIVKINGEDIKDWNSYYQQFQ